MAKAKQSKDPWVDRLNQSTIRAINFRKEATKLGLIVPYGVLPTRTKKHKGQEFIFNLPTAPIAMVDATPARVYRLVKLARKYADTHFMHEHFDLLTKLLAHRDHLSKNLRVEWLEGKPGDGYLTLREWLKENGKDVAQLLERLQLEIAKLKSHAH